MGLWVIFVAGGLYVAAYLAAIFIGAYNPLYRDLGPLEMVKLWLAIRMRR